MVSRVDGVSPLSAWKAYGGKRCVWDTRPQCFFFTCMVSDPYHHPLHLAVLLFGCSRSTSEERSAG